jgi:ParB family transcriptional regulator, chromosome partitioning protein
MGVQNRPGSQQSPATLALAALQPGPWQPRRVIHEQPLEELTASIKQSGVLQPIIVRPIAAGPVGAVTHEIVAGERRWQAAKLAGLENIPVLIKTFSDREAVAVALIENIQREALTPIEEARALTRLIEDFELTHQQAAEAIGRSRVAVSNIIRLLDLPAAVVTLIDSKALSMGHARALLGLESDAARERVGQLVAQRGLSVRETEKLVRRETQGERSTAGGAPKLSVISEVLRTGTVRVQLQQQSSGAGRLVVDFSTPEERDAIIECIDSVAKK